MYIIKNKPGKRDDRASSLFFYNMMVDFYSLTVL